MTVPKCMAFIFMAIKRPKLFIHAWIKDVPTVKIRAIRPIFPANWRVGMCSPLGINFLMNSMNLPLHPLRLKRPAA
ncbi:hypothetical protein [Thermovirga lienii]|uniref:hypothetical protein n=1 Tax=Thermovirga lienii TaxID=336261 RepID=UPI002FE36236